MNSIYAVPAVLIALLCFDVFAKTEMTYEEYEIELSNAQEREKTAREQIATEQASIEALNLRLIDLDRLIALVIKDKYDILGITDQDIVDAESEILLLRDRIRELENLIPEELLSRISDLNQIEIGISNLKRKSVCRLWRLREQVKDLEISFEMLKSRLLMKQEPMVYTVKENPARRDCLWRIAAYDNIYADPFQWPKIYRANKNLLDENFKRYKNRVSESKYSRPEDLIFPGQEFDIPR